MIIDKSENLREYLIRNNIGNDSPSTCVEHEGENTVKVNISREIIQDGWIICLIYHWSSMQMIVISFNNIFCCCFVSNCACYLRFL